MYQQFNFFGTKELISGILNQGMTCEVSCSSLYLLVTNFFMEKNGFFSSVFASLKWSFTKNTEIYYLRIVKII